MNKVYVLKQGESAFGEQTKKGMIYYIGVVVEANLVYPSKSSRGPEIRMISNDLNALKKRIYKEINKRIEKVRIKKENKMIEIPDFRKCGGGKGKDCCIFLVCGSKGFECQRNGSLRDVIIGNVPNMHAKRNPTKPYPECQKEK